MTMSQAKRPKSWTRMTAAELTEATREFDRPLPAERLRPMSKDRRQQFERSRRAALRREQADKTELVVVQVDRGILEKLGAYAEKHDTTVSALLNKGLKSVLAFVEP